MFFFWLSVEVELFYILLLILVLGVFLFLDNLCLPTALRHDVSTTDVLTTQQY